MKSETKENEVGYTKHLNLYQPKTCMCCRYRVNQHLIVLNLYGVSINKMLVTEFIGRSEFSSYGIELRNLVTQNDITPRVANSKIFIEILLSSY